MRNRFVEIAQTRFRFSRVEHGFVSKTTIRILIYQGCKYLGRFAKSLLADISFGFHPLLIETPAKVYQRFFALLQFRVLERNLELLNGGRKIGLLLLKVANPQKMTCARC